MKISRYIFLTFLFILLLFCITTYINFRLSEAVIKNEEYLSRSADIIKDGGRFQRNMLIMVNGLRGYLLTGERSFIDSYDSADIENDSILQELSSLLSDSSQSQLLNEIKTLNDQWTDEYTEPLRQAKNMSIISSKKLDTLSNLYKARFATGHERQIQEKLKEKFKRFTTFEYAVRERNKENLSVSVFNTRQLSLAFTILSMVAALIAINFLVIRISRRIGKMTEMADDIARGNYNVSIADPGQDELSSLGYSLNHMARQLTINISLLRRSYEELDQFAHLVSHDLKSPLRGIGNLVSWIEEDHKGELSHKVREYFELIKGRIRRAENLIEGLLSYARADKEKLEKELFEPAELVDEIIENMTDRENVVISVSKLPLIYTEKLLLFQIFSNLLDNAIKYNDKKIKEVDIYYEEHADTYEFFIKDNGLGIGENYHKRIFLIFQTLNDKDSFESTGVGLAIVKKILDSKNQKIVLVSEPGIGSTFAFTWPKK